MSGGFPLPNQLPAPLAAQYPPLFPVATIPFSNSTYETGGIAPPVNLSSASANVPANIGVTRTVFGGKRSRKARANKIRSRKARRRRHTRSRRKL